MTCQVVIRDLASERRILLVLDEDDFAEQRSRWHDEDQLLLFLQDKAFFAGRSRWSSLTLEHLHLMTINVLNMLGMLTDEQKTEKDHPLWRRLVFLLCGMISTIEDRSASCIELLRINRLSRQDVIYDYTATMNLGLTKPKPINPLRVVIDNQ